MTIFLTTHYMEEAARAGHIAIIDSGKLKEFGTPFELKEKYARDKLRLWAKPGRLEAVKGMLAEAGLENRSESFEAMSAQESEPVLAELSGSMAALPLLRQVEADISGFEVIQGSMDDVFLNVTGKKLTE